jgi:phosphoglycerate kinase
MKKTIRDIQNWRGKRALVREDFNVPLNEQGQITDDTRIREALPTLRYLSEQGAKIIVMSHLGRPKGKPSPEFSLTAIAKRLQELLPGITVHFNTDAVSDKMVEQTQNLQAGEILLLENIRFEPGEEKNDPELAKRLATLGDVYVNDAFGAAHRAHASTEGVAHHLDSKVAGFLMEKEIKALSTVYCHYWGQQDFHKNYCIGKFIAESQPSDYWWRHAIYVFKSPRASRWKFPR